MFKIVFTIMAFATLPSTNLFALDYYCNGQQVRYGSTKYYPNGQQVNYGSTKYYPNGQQLNYGSTRYYPNGQQFNYGTTKYYPNGQQVNYGSTLYYPNGQQVNYGSTCYYENGQTMGRCPEFVDASVSVEGYKFHFKLVLTDKSISLNERPVRISEGDVTTFFELDLQSASITNIRAICQQSHDVDEIMSLFRRASSDDRAEVRSQICH